MIIEIAKISEQGSTYTGELPAEVMDLEGDKFIQPDGPVAYELNADVVSDQVIIQGWVEARLKLLCVVCADFFSTTVRVSSFLRAYPIEPGLEVIDLTGDIREDILLEVPHYPRGAADEQEQCRECGRDLKEKEPEPPAGSPPDLWNPLDQLKL